MRAIDHLSELVETTLDDGAVNPKCIVIGIVLYISLCNFFFNKCIIENEVDILFW